MAEHPVGFWRYYGSVLSQFLREWTHGVLVQAGVAVAVAGAALVWWLRSRGGADVGATPSLVEALYTALGMAGALAGLHLVRSPWRLHQQAQGQIRELNEQIAEAGRSNALLQEHIHSQPAIGRYEIRQVDAGNMRRVVVLMVENSGVLAGRFEAEFSLHGTLWENHARLEALESDSRFCIGWRRDETPGLWAAASPDRWVTLTRGQRAFMVLAEIQSHPEDTNLRTVFRLQAVRRDDGVAIQPFAAGAAGECEMTLTVCSDPSFVTPFTRRYRVDVQGLHPLELAQ